jgi:signal transduction histidine kinase
VGSASRSGVAVLLRDALFPCGLLTFVLRLDSMGTGRLVELAILTAAEVFCVHRLSGPRVFALCAPLFVAATMLLPLRAGLLLVPLVVLGYSHQEQWYRRLLRLTSSAACYAAMVFVGRAVLRVVPGAGGLLTACAADAVLFTGLMLCLVGPRGGLFPPPIGLCAARARASQLPPWVASAGLTLLFSALSSTEVLLLARDGTLSFAIGVSLVVLIGHAAGRTVARVAEATKHERERADLLRQVLTESDRDRSRLLGALHDGPLQTVIAAQMVAQLHEDPELLAEIGDDIPDVTDLLSETVSEMRSIMRTGMAVSTGVRSLPEALTELAAEQRRVFRGTIDVDAEELPESLRPCAPLLFAVVREAVTNAVKHSGASRIEVAVGLRDGVVCATVTDNGRWATPRADLRTGSGFSGNDAGGHLGMRMMYERAAALRGELRVDIGETGTVVSCLVPTPPPASLWPEAVADRPAVASG